MNNLQNKMSILPSDKVFFVVQDYYIILLYKFAVLTSMH